MHGWAGNGCQLVKLAKNSHPQPLHSTTKAGCMFPSQHSCMLASTPMKIWHHGRTHIAQGYFFLFFQILFLKRKTATNTAQFGVFQPHRWALPSCELKGFKFCMHGRNAMLHHAKLGIVPQNTNCEPHAGKLGSRCALLAQHTQFAQDIRLPPTQSRNTTFTELWITIQPKAQNEKDALTI